MWTSPLMLLAWTLETASPNWIFDVVEVMASPWKSTHHGWCVIKSVVKVCGAVPPRLQPGGHVACSLQRLVVYPFAPPASPRLFQHQLHRNSHLTVHRSPYNIHHFYRQVATKIQHLDITQYVYCRTCLYPVHHVHYCQTSCSLCLLASEV